MSKGRRYEKYDHISEDVIRRACKGDGNALSTVISRYENYGRKCFRTYATTVFELDINRVPMDDLMQIVWMKFVEVVVKKFKISK